MLQTTIEKPPEIASKVRSRRRWVITLACLGAVGLLGALVVLHDSAAKPADSITLQALAVLRIPVAPSCTPIIVFHDTDTGPVQTTQSGDTLVASYDAGDTTLNQDKTTTLVIENTGNGPLTMQLDHVSCQCFRHIKLDGYIMGLRDRSATLRPGESGVLQITLKSDPDEIRVEELPKEGRFGITFNINSPAAAKLRVEATSRLVAGEEPKKAAQPK